MADEQEQYTLIEEIINLIILDSIQKNMNTSYNPLSDCEDDACQYIHKDKPFYIQYAYAYLNEDNQIIVVVSGGSSQYISVNTALFLAFDVDVDILDMSVNFTLSSYRLGNRELSIGMLDFIMDRMDKTAIENNMTFGELDLDNYKYTISITDAF